MIRLYIHYFILHNHLLKFYNIKQIFDPVNLATKRILKVTRLFLASI